MYCRVAEAAAQTRQKTAVLHALQRVVDIGKQQRVGAVVNNSVVNTELVQRLLERIALQHRAEIHEIVVFRLRYYAVSAFCFHKLLRQPPITCDFIIRCIFAPLDM